MSEVDREIEEMAQRIMLELGSASSQDLSEALYAKKMLYLSDIHYTKKMLKQIDDASSGLMCEIEKRAVIKALLITTWLHRFYFIIRTFIMGQLGAIITFFIIWRLGTINVMDSVIIGMFVFVFSLFITRIFDVQIAKATKKIVEYLINYRRIRDFIMNHF